MTPSDVVREEWQRAVQEFKLRPGSPTEAVVGRILERLLTLGSGRSELVISIQTYSAEQVDRWKVNDLVGRLGHRWPRKKIYNALGSLVRRGKIQSFGYGVYR